MAEGPQIQTYPAPAREYDEEIVPEGTLYGHLAMCATCKRWRRAGRPCQVCGHMPDIDMPLKSELQRDFYRVLLRVQHLFDPSKPNGGNATVKRAMHPAFLFNNNVITGVRPVFELLKVIAANIGRAPDDMMPEGAETVVMDADGVPWEFLRRGDSYQKLRPASITIAMPAPMVEASGGNVTSEVPCPECGEPIPRNGFGRTNHLKKHKPVSVDAVGAGMVTAAPR